MSSNYRDIESAQKNYNTMNQELYSGKALQDAMKGATPLAQTMANQSWQAANKAIRQQGLSAGRAADMASTAAAQGLNAGYTSGINNLMGAKGQALQSQGNYLANLQQQQQNKYNQTWGNITSGASALGTLAMAFSDENTKNAKMNNDPESIDDIFKRHQKICFKDLLPKEEEEE